MKSHGYDPTSFTEDEIPRGMSNIDQRFAESRRSILFVLQDIDSCKHESVETSHSYRDGKSQRNTLERLIKLHDLKTARKDDITKQNDPDALWLALFSMFDSHHKRAGGRKLGFGVMWNTGTEHVEAGWLERLQEAREWLSRSDGSVEPGEAERSHCHGMMSEYSRSQAATRSPTQTAEAMKAQTNTPPSNGSESSSPPPTNALKRRRIASTRPIPDELNGTEAGGQIHIVSLMLVDRIDDGTSIGARKKSKCGESKLPTAIIAARSGLYAGWGSQVDKGRDSIREEVRTIFDHLHQRQQNAISSVFRCIGFGQVHCSPCVKTPPESLAKLYAQCLGEDWIIAEGRLRESGWLLGFDMATALLSAFLYNEVYSIPSPWTREFEKGATQWEKFIR